MSQTERALIALLRREIAYAKPSNTPILLRVIRAIEDGSYLATKTSMPTCTY